MAQITVEQFRNFFKYYVAEEHQQRGVDELYRNLDLNSKEDDAKWITLYRTAPAKEPPAPEPVSEPVLKSLVEAFLESRAETKPQSEPVINDGAILLKVPYQSQLDNVSGTGYRECFSSSCAMVAMYYGKIANDDAYNLVRQKYGDSTDAAAQVAALKELGLEAKFVTNGTTEDVRRLLEKGQPVPVGWLHKGPSAAPTGGGHWSVIIGYKTGTWIVNDPNGEAALASGGYTDNTNGHNLQYSYKNFNPRWIVGGEGDGWYLDVKDPVKQSTTVTKQTTSTSQIGVDLIKVFEGCRTKAYVCPAGVLTIGYGHTGPDVRPGMQITEGEAERLLKEDLKRFENTVTRCIKVPLTQYEFDATVSFAFNVGPSALEHSTFCRRMNAGQNKEQCFKEEFPKWVNGSNGPLPGLVRRREAEVELATS